MTACAAHIFGTTTGLDCVRTDPHVAGHVYESTSAGDDRHADKGHG